MKRPRNADCGKIRRPLKRNKITDGIYGRVFRFCSGRIRQLSRLHIFKGLKNLESKSTFLYLRFLLVWALVLMADFILEFRFEYLWPFWLMLRSVCDSFKYQGLAFSVFFVCIAITSDVICYLFIPVQWLFFAASTYVWVQYVWHTERGICLPTVSLWLLFVYIEASVRLKELKSLPYYLDLCRPFAAHCIGYPVVTLGFGFKSYISYRLRLRRQKVVQKENEFYMQILQQALPPEMQYTDKPKALPSKAEEEVISNGVPGKKLSKAEEEKEGKKSSSAPSSPSSKSTDVNEDDELEYIEKSLPKKQANVNQFDEISDSFSGGEPPTKAFKTTNGVATAVAGVSSAAAMAVAAAAAAGTSKTVSKQLNSSKDNSAKKGKNYWKEQLPPAATFTNNKDEHISRLEADIKKLKADLQSSRNTEQELRVQINSLTAGEKSTRSELYQLQQDNENLQNKLHNLVTARQQDRSALAALERRLADEKRTRAAVEQQLQAERKTKKAEEAAAARAVAMAAAARTGECTDSCKARRRDLENDIKQLRRDLKIREDQYRQLEREVQSMRQFKDAQKEAEVLLKALSAMQDKNIELENSLTAETRFKQDLFSALGEERRVIKVLQNSIREKDCEITELKSKIAEVMALIPSTSTYQSLGSERTSSPLFSSSFRQEDIAVASDLNPNASDYTPKTAI
ncbi:macoilin-like isoform X2 [Pomacea canaliculata]|uniref:macoilin-like isoform X2 n=1 Tax=Pomacea canaliculata TaxID=400727 RepID=UPI000D736EF7|nr:macoilin-like isoform X2 [Pomacea canaliculata]